MAALLTLALGATCPPRAPAPRLLAGFAKGGGTPAAALTTKSSAAEYRRLVAAGALSVDCFARVDPAVAASFAGSDTEAPSDATDEWLFVGRVAVGQTGTLTQAAQRTKRLILEHAAKVSKRLRLQRKSLVVGLQAPYSIVSLRRPDNMPEELECGFVGDVSEFLDYRPADSPARVAGGEGGGEGAG